MHFYKQFFAWWLYFINFFGYWNKFQHFQFFLYKVKIKVQINDILRFLYILKTVFWGIFLKAYIAILKCVMVKMPSKVSYEAPKSLPKIQRLSSSPIFPAFEAGNSSKNQSSVSFGRIWIFNLLLFMKFKWHIIL